MAYFEQEGVIANINQLQADTLQDIALSLRILSKRTSLKEERLYRKLEDYQRCVENAATKEEYKEKCERIHVVKKQLEVERLKREIENEEEEEVDSEEAMPECMEKSCHQTACMKVGTVYNCEKSSVFKNGYDGIYLCEKHASRFIKKYCKEAK